MKKVIHLAALVVMFSIGGAGSVAVPMTWYDLYRSCTSCHG